MEKLMPTLMTATLLLAGCDVVSDGAKQALEKGNLDAIVRCMESNASKEVFLSDDYIKQECIKEYSSQTSEDLESEDCSAAITFSKAYATLGFDDCDCRNKSDRIITSITTTVNLQNIDGKASSSLRFRNTRERLFILPDACFDFSSYALIDEKDRELIPDDIPFCSKLDPGQLEVCKSWTINSFGSVRANIK